MRKAVIALAVGGVVTAVGGVIVLVNAFGKSRREFDRLWREWETNLRLAREGHVRRVFRAAQPDQAPADAQRIINYRTVLQVGYDGQITLTIGTNPDGSIERMHCVAEGRLTLLKALQQAWYRNGSELVEFTEPLPTDDAGNGRWAFDILTLAHGHSDVVAVTTKLAKLEN